MYITLQAMYAIERCQHHARADHYQFGFELVNDSLWLRIDFGNTVIPVSLPEHFNTLTSTLDYLPGGKGFVLRTTDEPASVPSVCRSLADTSPVE